ncbi:MAG: hypothetical protein AAF492_21680, partial [Verrucomicrobiota bacterium]
SGTNGAGYFAVVGFNQEGNTTPAAITNDPADGKFFNYPKYVNPLNTNNVYIMYVEPYQFGLSYPDPLHPTGPGAFSSVAVAEGFTEDVDFHLFDIGTIDYPDGMVTGVGTETVGVANLTLTLDGSEFESLNRVELVNGVDIGPFGPRGRSNRNEARNAVSLTASNLTGTGLTFVNGALASMEFTADVSARMALAGAPPNPLFTYDATGSLTFSGLDVAFAVDGQDSTPFGSDVRLLLNRSGTVSQQRRVRLESAMDPSSFVSETAATHGFARIDEGDGSLGTAGSILGDGDGLFNLDTFTNQPPTQYGSDVDLFPRESEFLVGNVVYDSTLVSGSGVEQVPIMSMDLSDLWTSDPNRTVALPGTPPSVLSDLSDHAFGTWFFNGPGTITFGPLDGSDTVSFLDGLLASIDLEVEAVFTVTSFGTTSWTGTLSAAGDRISFQINQTRFPSTIVFDLNGTILSVETNLPPNTAPVAVADSLTQIFVRKGWSGMKVEI